MVLVRAHLKSAKMSKIAKNRQNRKTVRPKSQIFVQNHRNFVKIQNLQWPHAADVIAVQDGMTDFAVAVDVTMLQKHSNTSKGP